MVRDLGGTLGHMATKKKPNRPRPAGGPRTPGSRPAPKPGPGAGSKAAGTAPKAAGTAPKPAAAKVRERTGPTRAERLAAAEAARRRKAARTRALIILGVVAIVAVLTTTIIASRRSNNAAIAKLEASGSCKYDGKSDTDGGPGNNHVEGDVKYDVNPPAGGNHNPTPSPPGVFTADTTPPDAQIVHSLEHGYIAIWYRPDLPSTQLDDLKSLATKYNKDILLVPRASLTKPVAATAWHHRLLCSQPDLTALESFVTTYRNQGPEKIPH
jgi:hypothetical protein